jgi:Secretion system C-terminal sorting domain
MKLQPRKLFWNSLLFFLILTKNEKMDAQLNLILDSSFEDTIKLDMFEPRIQLSTRFWKNLDSSREFISWAGYFYLQHPFINHALPIGYYYYYQYPKSGNGFAVFTNYWKPSFPILSPRSLTRAPLHQTLTAGKKYCAKAYLASTENEHYFTNGFGMYFDNGQLDTIVAQDSSGIYTFVQPQVQAQQIIDDTLNWTLVSNTFVANGTESFVTLGNFLSDSATLKSLNLAGIICECSDMGVDDVSLIPVDIAGWLQDTSVVLGDSVYIGQPIYEVPDAVWYDMQGNKVHTGSGFTIKATQSLTQFIETIDVCDRIARDTISIYAAPLRVQEVQNFSFSVYPNPTDGLLNIQTNANNKILIVASDICGKIILQKEFAPNHLGIYQFSLQNYLSGLYIISVTDQYTKKKISKKIVLE